MADNIRLITFAGSTVAPQDDALVYETAIGQNGIIKGGAVTLKNNNTLHIAAGHGIICGRKFSIVESDITVLLTTGDTLQGRLYIHLDLSNTTDPIQILTEIGSTLSEPIQQSDVNISNGIYEFNVATFTIDALTISDLIDLKPYVENVMEKVKKLEEAEVDTLTTLEQVEASTDNSIPVGAGAVKQLNNSLEEQPQFVYDENGQITGYTTKIGGADTVFPFKSDLEFYIENARRETGHQVVVFNIPCPINAEKVSFSFDSITVQKNTEVVIVVNDINVYSINTTAEVETFPNILKEFDLATTNGTIQILIQTIYGRDGAYYVFGSVQGVAIRFS